MPLRLTAALPAFAAALFLSGTGAFAAPKGCPPGLAKKSASCVAPGHAKKSLRAGDRLPSYGVRVQQPTRYGLPRARRGESYYRVGNTFFRVNRDTR